MLTPTPDLSALAEQLCRIEHKLDLVVRFLATQHGEFPLTPLKEGIDPLTHEPVTYYMDLLKRHVVRVAKDGTGLVPPLGILFDPPTPNKPNQGTGNNNGGNEGTGDAG